MFSLVGNHEDEFLRWVGVNGMGCDAEEGLCPDDVIEAWGGQGQDAWFHDEVGWGSDGAFDLEARMSLFGLLDRGHATMRSILG